MRRRRPDHDMVNAARNLAGAMKRVSEGINDVAVTSAKLLALLDNAEGTETLSSIRADTAFQLVGNLSGAYEELAGFLATVAR